MNLPEAEQLLDRIEAGWPESHWTEQRRDIWLEELAELDEAAADRAVHQLVRTYERCPSLATVRATAEALRPRHATSTTGKCGWCDDTGWVQNFTHPSRHRPDCHSTAEFDCDCTVDVPCPHCPTGVHIARNIHAWT